MLNDDIPEKSEIEKFRKFGIKRKWNLINIYNFKGRTQKTFMLNVLQQLIAKLI